MTCETCKYWQGQEQAGMCHRFPRAELKGMNDWCGEHAYREVIQKSINDYGVPRKQGRPRKAK